MIIAKEKTFMIPKDETGREADQQTEAIETVELTRKQKIVRFFKKIGFWGFMFFLIKGLIWVAVFLGVGKLFT